MKKYQNLTEQRAKEKGFYANYAFASDEKFAPNGKDVTKCRDIKGNVTFEVSEYNKEKKTIDVLVMSPKEYYGSN